MGISEEILDQAKKLGIKMDNLGSIRKPIGNIDYSMIIEIRLMRYWDPFTKKPIQRSGDRFYNGISRCFNHWQEKWMVLPLKIP